MYWDQYFGAPDGSADTIALFHDESDTPERSDIRRRITFDGNEIREQSRCSSSDAAFHVQDARVDGRCGPERVDRLHAVTDHQFQFTGVVSVRKDADIRAARDGHAGRERRLKRFTLPTDRCRLGLAALL